jgi:uncharacterized membrane protein
MNINIRNFFITGILGVLIGFIFNNPLIFVPLAIINGVVCSIFIPVFEDDT